MTSLTMSRGTADLLGQSFALVSRDSERFADSFFHRLFEIAPEVAPLFKSDLRELGRKFVSMLGVLVAGLHRFDLLEPMLVDCALRHAGYGVEPSHYVLVGEALLWALEGVFGEDEPALEAWRQAYEAVAETMIAAAFPDLSDALRLVA